MSQEQITNTIKETRKSGKELAEKILAAKPKKGAFVLGLVGELGGGKTTFIQGFAKGLKIKEKILSPTFIIYKKFPIANFQFTKKRQMSDVKCFRSFYHIDCYRIKKPKELLGLGFKEIISDSENIVAVEWADRIKKIMPKNTLWIKFKFMDGNKRKITYGRR